MVGVYTTVNNLVPSLIGTMYDFFVRVLMELSCWAIETIKHWIARKNRNSLFFISVGVIKVRRGYGSYNITIGKRETGRKKLIYMNGKSHVSKDASKANCFFAPYIIPDQYAHFSAMCPVVCFHIDIFAIVYPLHQSHSVFK